MNVLGIKLALNINARIRVQELVVKMLFVTFLTIFQCVDALKECLEMHL